jgi:pyochelin biosynthetic protein PchC
MNQRSGAPSSDWLRIYHPTRAEAPHLICLAHAGAGATAFFGLSKQLSPRINVLAVQYPGHQDRRNTQCIIDIRDLADGVYSALANLRDRQIALFGHSMGALVGYELALRFDRESDKRLIGFIPSAHRAPSDIHKERVSLTDDELLATLRKLNGTDTRVLQDDRMLRLILPALRADYRAIARYRHEPDSRVRCPTIVCVGDEDPLVSVYEALMWQKHVEAPFYLRVFRGGHFYIKSWDTLLAWTIGGMVADWAREPENLCPKK